MCEQKESQMYEITHFSFGFINI